ncbi:hypothetical protein [Mesorhizobium metallidurans]|nr:hypothetical protein [Mesorhizobium metallidurans]
MAMVIKRRKNFLREEASMPNERNAMIADIRRFNRFYTSWTGLLDETLTQSAYTLTEARVLFELGNRPGTITAHPRW